MPCSTDRSEAGGVEDRHPARQLGLDREVPVEHAAYLQLERVVTLAVPCRGERIVGALLVQVDQRDPPTVGVGEHHHGAEQRGPEADVLQRRVHRVHVVDE